MNHRCLFDMSDLDIGKPYYSINIYKFRILDSLPPNYYENFLLLVSKSNSDYLEIKYPYLEQVVYEPLKKRAYLFSIMWTFLERRHFRKFVNNIPCDRFFSASNIDYKLTMCIKARKVIVVHDIKSIWEVKGLKRIRVKNYYRELINTSDVVISISNFTKKHIVDNISRINIDKLHVVYNCVKLANESVAPNYVVCGKYILYVNTLDEYKNILTLAKAYARSSLNSIYKLVVVAKRNEYWEKIIYPLFEEYGIEKNVKLYSGVEDGVLKYLYENASLFVSPSLNEGFGYTPIEAALCCCPVLCTRCEALPDTTKGLLNYYNNPKDEVELANEMERILSEEKDSMKLKKISTTFQELYSPQKQIQAILELLGMR